jgi:PDZ domain
MRRLWTLAFSAAVAVSAVAARPAAAQVTPRGDRDTAAVRAHGFNYFYGPDQVRVASFQRGRLGILVDLTPDPARDSIGAKVAGVTPGGPADKAGVQAGDLVVRLNGQALVRRGASGGNDDGGAVSRPGTRLIELASRLDPGDTVKLDLRRGNRPLSVTLVAQESGADEIVRRFDFDMPHPGGREYDFIKVPGGPTNFSLSAGPLASMELVNVNPGLAEYFGTSEGLLIVNVGNDSTLGLRNGDVILSIGGRKPGSPVHALRILGTYDPNETVTFEVMRMKHRITVTGKMPEQRRGAWTVSPNSFEFDPAPLLRSWGRMADTPRTLLNLPFVPAVPNPGAVRAET